MKCLSWDISSANLQFLVENIEVFDIGNGEQGYLLRPPKGNKFAASSFEYRLSIGPLEVSVNVRFWISMTEVHAQVNISIDLSTFSVGIKVILHLPIIGGVTVANVVGNLKEGVNLHIGYPGILGGSIALKIDDNSDVVFSWDFTAFGKGYKGSKVLLHI